MAGRWEARAPSPAPFYSPNFLSYNISPYLNQSRANSNFQSISNASGVNATVEYLRGQPVSRFGQLFQGLQQRRKLRRSRSGQLCDPRQQRHVRHQLERERSRHAQLLGGLPTGQQPVLGVWDQRRRARTRFIRSICIPATNGRASTWAPTTPTAAATRRFPQIVAGEITETHSDNQRLRIQRDRTCCRCRARSRRVSTAPIGTPIIWATTPPEPLTRSTRIAAVHPTRTLSLTATRELLRQSDRAIDPVGHRCGRRGSGTEFE